MILACSSILGAFEDDEPDEQIAVARLPGVSPKVALVWVGRYDLVLVPEGTDLPPEVAQSFDAPKCDRRDAPIRLTGPWLGILGADGNTEIDLLPPYDLDLRVKYASVTKYERAFIRVRVQKGSWCTTYPRRCALLAPSSRLNRAHSLLRKRTIRRKAGECVSGTRADRRRRRLDQTQAGATRRHDDDRDQESSGFLGPRLVPRSKGRVRLDPSRWIQSRTSASG